MKLPDKLLQSLQTAQGFNEDTFRQTHELNIPVTSIRLNAFKLTDISQLNFSSNASKVLWSSNGYYLSERPLFTIDPFFHAGAYYVQEASSMFLELALKQSVDVSNPLQVLDVCAAPGGKSTLLQSVLSKESVLISNEVIKSRVAVLAENITKCGAANVIVTNNDPEDFQRLPNFFDVVVVDAPCSGSGLFRKDVLAVNEWSQANVELCSQRQKRILDTVMPSIKNGGVLIYSTCSYSVNENEFIADWIMENYSFETIQLNIETDWGIVETVSNEKKAYGYRFYPDKVKGEGFFMAVFKKQDKVTVDYKDEVKPLSKEKKSPITATASAIATIKPYLNSIDDFFFIKQNEELIAMPLHLKNLLAIIQSNLYIKKAGVKIGTIIRNTLIPSHELALSTIINKNILNAEIDLNTALQYLRKLELCLSPTVQGWQLVTYNKLPLGWIKVIGNRINNYYPSAWRILNK